MHGLTRTSAADASLLLNLEAVLTALIAWVVFRENADRRIVLGMALIVAGGVVLAWPATGTGRTSLIGALSVTGACAYWVLDNNLTRRVSANDPLFIAGTKGLVAGITNIALALARRDCHRRVRRAGLVAVLAGGSADGGRRLAAPYRSARARARSLPGCPSPARAPRRSPD
jgi:drug/metabolite transporter (DMT)-like permease